MLVVFLLFLFFFGGRGSTKLNFFSPTTLALILGTPQSSNWLWCQNCCSRPVVCTDGWHEHSHFFETSHTLSHICPMSSAWLHGVCGGRKTVLRHLNYERRQCSSAKQNKLCTNMSSKRVFMNWTMIMNEHLSSFLSPSGQNLSTSLINHWINFWPFVTHLGP